MENLRKDLQHAIVDGIYPNHQEDKKVKVAEDKKIPFEALTKKELQQWLRVQMQFPEEVCKRFEDVNGEIAKLQIFNLGWDLSGLSLSLFQRESVTDDFDEAIAHGIDQTYLYPTMDL